MPIPFTFKYYILNYNTTNTINYKMFLEETIDYLPERICSSKIIYHILRPYFLSGSISKQNLFKNTFLEYIKEKIKIGDIDDDIVLR